MLELLISKSFIETADQHLTIFMYGSMLINVFTCSSYVLSTLYTTQPDHYVITFIDT